MPIYEYACKACAREFEMLVLKSTVVACPECKSADLERRFSLPSVSSEGTRQRALKSAKQRDARQGNERVQPQREYEASHDD